MKLQTFSQFSSNASRFRTIITVFAKYGFANWVRDKDPEFIKGLFTNSEGGRLAGLPLAARLRMALTELGTTFIKLGRISVPGPILSGPILQQN